MTPDVLYKVNIYAIVRDSSNQEVESDNLHSKVIVMNERLCLYSDEEAGTGAETMSRQVSVCQP